MKMYKKVIIIFICILSLTSLISLYLFRQGYRTHFDNNIQSLIEYEYNNLVFEFVKDDYVVQTFENEEEIYFILYKKFAGLVKFYKVDAFPQRENRIINYSITWVEPDYYIYFGVIYDNDAATLSFLRDDSVELIEISSNNKIFFGQVNDYENFNDKYTVYDSNGDILAHK